MLWHQPWRRTTSCVLCRQPAPSVTVIPLAIRLLYLPLLKDKYLVATSSGHVLLTLVAPRAPEGVVAAFSYYRPPVVYASPPGDFMASAQLSRASTVAALYQAKGALPLCIHGCHTPPLESPADTAPLGCPTLLCCAPILAGDTKRVLPVCPRRLSRRCAHL